MPSPKEEQGQTDKEGSARPSKSKQSASEESPPEEKATEEKTSHSEERDSGSTGRPMTRPEQVALRRKLQDKFH